MTCLMCVELIQVMMSLMVIVCLRCQSCPRDQTVQHECRCYPASHRQQLVRHILLSFCLSVCLFVCLSVCPLSVDPVSV